MKPHPRIRKTIKWGGAAVTVLLVVVWIGSWRWSISYWRYRTHFNTELFALNNGRIRTYVELGKLDQEDINAPTEWCTPASRPPSHQRWFYLNRCSYGRDLTVYFIDAPIWGAAALALLATIIAAHLDARARRRARLDLCSTCTYDRTGLAPDVVCPECGTLAP